MQYVIVHNYLPRYSSQCVS